MKQKANRLKEMLIKKQLSRMQCLMGGRWCWTGRVTPCILTLETNCHSDLRKLDGHIDVPYLQMSYHLHALSG